MNFFGIGEAIGTPIKWFLNPFNVLDMQKQKTMLLLDHHQGLPNRYLRFLLLFFFFFFFFFGGGGREGRGGRDGGGTTKTLELKRAFVITYPSQHHQQSLFCCAEIFPKHETEKASHLCQMARKIHHPTDWTPLNCLLNDR